jgi:hypothetical protein
VTEDLEVAKEMLLDRVADQVAVYGFKRANGQEFHLAHSWGKSAIHLSIIEHKRDFDATMDLAVRFDALEELINRTNLRLSAKERQNTFSIGAEIGNLVDRKPLRWTIGTPDDVEDVARQIGQHVTNTALKYLNEFADMNRALQIFLSDERDAWICCPIHSERAKRAVGMAWLLGGEQKAKDVAASKRLFLRDRKDFGLPDFEAFVNSLLGVAERDSPL